MMEHIKAALDWTSIKLCGFPVLGIVVGEDWIRLFSCLGIATTIVYNAVRIYKEFKNKNKQP